MGVKIFEWKMPQRVLCAFVLVALLFGASGAVHAAAEGSDLDIGGAGSGPGQFLELRDIAFDAANNVYVLDGLRFDNRKKEYTGNGRVQKFDAQGKFLSEFSVRDAALGEKNDPQRIAVDSKGNVYVTQPKADVVQHFGADGKLLQSIALPRPSAITIWTAKGQEQIAVLSSRNDAVQENGKKAPGSGQVDVIGSNGVLGTPIKLARALRDVQDMASDRAGNLYVLAATNQIYKFDATGALSKIIGAAANTRNPDGSELLHSVAVDSKGNIYAMTWGNPGRVTRFDPGITTISQRDGQFQYGDPWSAHSRYVPLAVDRNDRLWVGATSVHNPDGSNFKYYKPSPAVVRTENDFFNASKKGVTQRSALLLGLTPSITTSLPYNIAYDLQPVPVEFLVAAANRQVREVDVSYRVQDAFGNAVSQGKFSLPLQNNVEAKQAFSFTPPKLGWYSVSCELSHRGQRLLSIGRHFGVTSKFSGMNTLAAGESPGGWTDAPRQMFVGLVNMRLHAKAGNAEELKKHIAELEKQVDMATRYGATFFVQFSDKKDCTPEIVRTYVQHFKGRVKVWEIMNEPNFSMKPEEYVAMLKQVSPLIKSLDPQAQVMGPALCGILMGWYESFYKLGGGPLVDILSLHDYEGNESIDEVHWRWKFDALRKLMAQHGDADKPVWQTERVLGGVRGGNFLGLTQAVRVTMHRDLLETLGVPTHHSNHYYLNEGGYSKVPSYLWSRSGPHPGALALRTRYAMTSALKREYSGALNFGPTGNKIFMGLRYKALDGSTIVLRNMGTLDEPLELNVSGGNSMRVVDAFGNSRSVSVEGGRVRLSVSQMPQYLMLNKGQEVTPVPIDFGRNIASGAKFSYSAPVKGDAELLNNGSVEVFHDGSPQGSAGNPKFWIGDLPITPSGQVMPQTLEISFAQPRSINKMLIRSLRADNPFCALLDYDLQYFDAGKWVTIEEVRTPQPLTNLVDNAETIANTWYQDTNFFVHQFRPVTTDKLRLVVRRATYGFTADEIARDANKKTWGSKGLETKLMLREIEIY
jgi:sugar lactone lactonase YvrE